MRGDLTTMMQESQGGPAAAVIGALNKKADALDAQLTVAKADAQADLGPKITAAQDEITDGPRAGDHRREQALPLELTHRVGSFDPATPAQPVTHPAAPPVPLTPPPKETPMSDDTTDQTQDRPPS